MKHTGSSGNDAGGNDREAILVRGARQNNLRHLDLDIPTRQLVVVTGVSGSGKSSLVFDTLYAEGQRRYVETFSPYARQFLDRMDKPAVDRIEGIPPAIAIDQTNPVRTSRSTVGTMTELNDHLKLLFARTAKLYCKRCAAPVRRDSPQDICADLRHLAAHPRDTAPDAAPRVLICFTVDIPKNFDRKEIEALLTRQGYTRIRPINKKRLEVIQDRLRIDSDQTSRLTEAIETALLRGRGRMHVHRVAAHDVEQVEETRHYSSGLHCAACDITYREPTSSSFSFNSPAGACEACRGFGRIIGVDYGLVIPDPAKSLRGGAVRPWQTDAYRDCQLDLERLARKRGIPLDTPWHELDEDSKKWVLEGEGEWAKNVWYGVRRFFTWLESKSYKMHIRVLLSKYRAYTPCHVCHGARLNSESLLWRLGDSSLASETLHNRPRFRPADTHWTDSQLDALPGLCLHDLMLLPIERVKIFFDHLSFSGHLDQATEMLLGEIRSRFAFLQQVGLGYLTLDRQSRSLSGGEVQRINLTTALGTSLVNTLFVLDEPSIGLHPRDMQRVIDVMHRLRDAGNSLLVVEHDPQIMQQADLLIDMGPGAGEHGGRIVSIGTPTAVTTDPESLTGAYLGGRKRVALPRSQAGTGTHADHWLELRGARQHNLKDIDVRFPLKRLVCLTGVSGSGKSTLLQDILYPALLKHFGKPAETPGEFTALTGTETLTDVMFVDQTPIGRTARSNPASYVGAFDVIREKFAKLAESKERGYTAGTFSFNSGTGRCPSCSGSGFEHVEMQFLSDVYLRCGDCDGRRYRTETLEVRHPGANGSDASIADVLEMTVTEACVFFAHLPEVAARLTPLMDVGLDYLRLGQPVPTLSGGEAQRLKLAGHLVESAQRDSGPKLFLFDEPTTGLHFEDIAKLLTAFRKLIDAGHSLIVIEHNLDVVAAAEWLIDLGPEGGDHGGCLVAAGTPADLMAHPSSHTGAALRAYQQQSLVICRDDRRKTTLTGKRSDVQSHAQRVGEPVALTKLPDRESIRIHNAREHNLKNIDVELPRGAFNVITGVSGSGKSTLAFDIIFNEGQRRYLESLNAYARQFVQPAAKPEVDSIRGIPPTVAIEQRTSRGGRKSTVATLTEIYHFLRLLYVKLGTQYCPDCKLAIEPQSIDAIVNQVMRQYRGQSVDLLAPLIVSRKGLYTDLAKWAAGKGYRELRVDGQRIPVKPWPRLDRFKEHDIELPVARLGISARGEADLRAKLLEAMQYGKGMVQILPVDGGAVAAFSTKRACPDCGTSFAELDPRLFSFNSKQGWCKDCFGTGEELTDFDAEDTGEERAWIESEESSSACRSCNGARLNPIARAVRFRDLAIHEFTCQSVDDSIKGLKNWRLGNREQAIARDLLKEINGRLAFLQRVGLGYLQLDRAAPTLSGGESQRIRLAAQLGSNLRGVCYVLDEPTIGLHPRDNKILLDALGELASHRNTLVVVEHDEDTIRRADHVIDLGPGAGVRGGKIVGEGTIQDLLANPDSITGRYLRSPLQHRGEPRRQTRKNAPALWIREAALHNLKSIDAQIPLQRLVVVTGVSGSGKSTLARDVLYASARAMVVGDGKALGCKTLEGIEHIDRVLEVDQTPIGKTPRSCPATYVGIWDDIRKIFAGTAESRLRGYTAGRFSFNTAGGRCAACEGQGVQTIEMSFLPDVKLPCDACHGQRFNDETLSIRYRDQTIGEVLAMNMEDGVEFFEAHPTIKHVLQLLCEVGLGYLTLGQASPTLSGGEAQRIKLVTELSKVRTDLRAPLRSKPKHSLYVLDEPTVGLHMADVEKLIGVLHRLVDAGNTVVVVEHDLDIIAEADWVIDMGPEAGVGGGRVIGQCPPQQLAKRPGRSHTGAALKDFLTQRGLAYAS